MSGLWRDLRFGLRQLASRPGFSVVAVLTLALGIGAVSAIATVIDAVLFAELPYPQAERLVLITGVNRSGAGEQEWPISYLDFADWRERTVGFTGLAAHTNPRSFNLLVGAEPERVSGEMVSAAYFPLLGVSPAQGRAFTAEEDAQGAEQRVVVLGWELWGRLFGADARLDAQSVTLNEESYRVVGVMPRGFRGLTDGAQLWLPVVLAAKVYGPPYIEMRPFRWLTVLGRLAPGVSREQAQESLDAIAAGLETEHPEVNQGISGRLTPLAEAWFGELAPALRNLAAGAVFVLLIACANVANLLLARAAARRGEVAIRQALGADRRRLVRQLLTEGALLALLGTAAGLVLSRWVTGLLTRLSAVDFRSFVDFRLGGSVLAVTAAVALGSVALFALAPAWMGSRVDLASVLREGGRSGGGRRRLAGALVVAEVWVAVVLLVAAALAVRGFARLRATDLGFVADGVLTVRADLQGPRMAGDEPKRLLARQLLERLEGGPGVRAVALAGPHIPTDDWLSAHFTIEGWAGPPGEETVVLNVHSVTPEYFAALGIPLRAGRDLRLDDDDQAPPVVVVSEAVVRRFWPGEDPLGKRLKFGAADGGSPWFTVVGVVGEVSHRGLGDGHAPRSDLYFSLFHLPPTTPPILNVLVRGAGPEPAALTSVVRGAMREVAPTLPLYDAKTLASRLDEQVAEDRFLLLLAAAFAGLALLLAAVGLYGVLSYAVSRQRREIGIRMALGERRGQVVGRVVRRGMAWTLVGLALGVATTLALARPLASLLHGLPAADPLSLGAASAVLLAVALAAGYLPARRAARVEPTVTLKAE